jgi:hypothetical protein
MNFFKDEIEHLGDKLEIALVTTAKQVSTELNTVVQEAIMQSSGELNKVVQQAGEGLQWVVQQAGEELGKQRTLTKTDVQALIEFAANALDTRVEQRLNSLCLQVRSMVVRIAIVAAGFLLAVIAMIRFV